MVTVSLCEDLVVDILSTPDLCRCSFVSKGWRRRLVPTAFSLRPTNLAFSHIDQNRVWVPRFLSFPKDGSLGDDHHSTPSLKRQQGPSSLNISSWAPQTSSSSTMATAITTTKASPVVLHRMNSITATLTLRRKDLPVKKRYGYFSRIYESNFDLSSSPSLTHSLVLFDDLLPRSRGFFQRTWHRISGGLRRFFQVCVSTISSAFHPLIAVFCTNVPMDKK